MYTHKFLGCDFQLNGLFPLCWGVRKLVPQMSLGVLFTSDGDMRREIGGLSNLSFCQPMLPLEELDGTAGIRRS